MRRRTCQGCENCYKLKFLECVNDHICGPWIRAVIVENEAKSRERKLHPRFKDPSLKKYFVNVIMIDESKYMIYELCLACESMGYAKCYFSSNSHKCKAGGCCDGIILFLIDFECIMFRLSSCS